MKLKIIIGITYAIFIYTLSTPLLTAQGTITVVDGDTIKVAGVLHRLHGIDAPEFGQSCARAGGGTWRCGKRAAERLETLISTGPVHCEPRDHDRYGRVIALCLTSAGDLGAAMVGEGLAWAFRRYSEDYAHVEDQARADELGIWQALSEPAWDYRARRWAVAAQEAPAGCPIKGNISDAGRIYHTPWSPWYSRTRISEAKGERWFCDEAEAIAAGWRAPRWR